MYASASPSPPFLSLIPTPRLCYVTWGTCGPALCDLLVLAALLEVAQGLYGRCHQLQPLIPRHVSKIQVQHGCQLTHQCTGFLPVGYPCQRGRGF